MMLRTGVATSVLQSLVLPGLDLGAPEDMYVRLDDKARISLREKVLAFRDGGRAIFDTFFNGFTIATWRDQCAIADLRLVLHGRGKFILRFGLHRGGYGHRWLDEMIVDLTAAQPAVAPLACWPDLTDGMLYFTLEAVGEATLRAGAYETATPAVRDVKLGVVITHFNRKRMVLPALRRVREQLFERGSGYRGKIELIVVDNSRTILAEEAVGVTLIPNRNLGGSGGFMRGLLYLKDRGFSHCLFMDDDASCEIESIRRCYALLRYATSARMAVAGSLMRETEPNRLFEKGARFDGLCRPLKSGLDMRVVGDLLAAERTDQVPDYGAWWFFGFAITAVKHYAFPFFVRGDDIQFSTLNKFEILTMNGIGCWAEDFSYKSGPLTDYLDTRYHILQNLCVRGASRASIMRMLGRFFFLAACSYNYGSARAVTLAISDVLKGPNFWMRDMDMREKRAEIQAFGGAEKMLPIDRTLAAELRRPPHHETGLRRLIRRATLNGFLLPGFMLRKDVAFQHKGFAGTLRQVFRSRQVLYEHEPSQTGYFARHDKRRFFAALLDFSGKLARFAVQAEPLRRHYRNSIPVMTSEAFWRDIYDDELSVTAGAKLVPLPSSAALLAEAK